MTKTLIISSLCIITLILGIIFISRDPSGIIVMYISLLVMVLFANIGELIKNIL